jgi:hypothetical protein
VRETPLETSFCRQAILHDDFLYVPDTARDPRFEGNPLVSSDPGLRFYRPSPTRLTTAIGASHSSAAASAISSKSCSRGVSSNR